MHLYLFKGAKEEIMKLDMDSGAFSKIGRKVILSKLLPSSILALGIYPPLFIFYENSPFWLAVAISTSVLSTLYFLLTARRYHDALKRGKDLIVVYNRASAQIRGVGTGGREIKFSRSEVVEVLFKEDSYGYLVSFILSRPRSRFIRKVKYVAYDFYLTKASWGQMKNIIFNSWVGKISTSEDTRGLKYSWRRKKV